MAIQPLVISRVFLTLIASYDFNKVTFDVYSVTCMFSLVVFQTRTCIASRWCTHTTTPSCQYNPFCIRDGTAFLHRKVSS